MNRKYSRLAAFGLLGISGLFAQPLLAATYIPCDGCSATQMTNAAMAQGAGRYIVGNVTQDTVEALHVYSIASKAVAKVFRIDHAEMTAAEKSAFSSYVKFYNAAPVGYHKHFNLVIVGTGSYASMPSRISATQRISAGTRSASASGGGSVSYPTAGVTAYTVVDGGPAQNAFLEWIGGLTAYGISDTMIAGMQTLPFFHVTNTDQLLGVSFTVTFTDGSHVGAHVDIIEQPPQLKVNQNAAVDSHGNAIPASYAAVAGTGKQHYDFSGDGNRNDIVNMQKRIRDFGVDLPASSRYECHEYFSNGVSKGVRCGVN